MNLMPIIYVLSEFVPSIKKLFDNKQLDNTANSNITNKVIAIAKSVTKTHEEQGIVTALKNNPEVLIKFQHEIIALHNDLENKYLEDVANARQRDAIFLKANKKNIRADIMVIAAAVGLLSCLISLVYYKSNLPGEAVGIISTVAGIFGSCLKDAYSFEFGSSRGSRSKDIAALVKELK